MNVQPVRMEFPDEPAAEPLKSFGTGRLSDHDAGAIIEGSLLPSVKVTWADPLKAVQNAVIKDQADLTAADMIRQEILADLRKIDETFDPLIQKAHEQHKAILAKKKEFAGPRLAALDVLKPKIAAYIDEQDRLRLQAEREAELKRQEAKRIAEKAVDKAWGLVDKGKGEKAEEVLKEAAEKAGELEAAAPVVPEKPQAQVSLREAWSPEIVDVTKIPREYMVPDMMAIGQIVRARKDKTNIPGIRAVMYKVVADKGSRR